MTGSTDKDAPAKADAEDPAPIPTPSPTLYSEMAMALIAAVDRLIESVPDFGAPVVASAVVERKRRVPPGFVASAVNALTVSSELQGVKGLNAVQAIDDKQFVDAFEPLEAHLATTLKGLKRVILARKARLTASAQQIYAFSKALARERDAAPIGDHVDEMKKTLRPVRRRKADDPLEQARKEGTTTKSSSQQ
jgi:hypothetical protein